MPPPQLQTLPQSSHPSYPSKIFSPCFVPVNLPLYPSAPHSFDSCCLFVCLFVCCDIIFFPLPSLNLRREVFFHIQLLLKPLLYNQLVARFVMKILHVFSFYIFLSFLFLFFSHHQFFYFFIFFFFHHLLQFNMSFLILFLFFFF